MWTPILLHPHQPGPRDGDGYEWQSQREPNFEANLSCETNEGEFGEKERGEDQHRVVVQKSGKKKASAKAGSPSNVRRALVTNHGQRDKGRDEAVRARFFSIEGEQWRDQKQRRAEQCAVGTVASLQKDEQKKQSGGESHNGEQAIADMFVGQE